AACSGVGGDAIALGRALDSADWASLSMHTPQPGRKRVHITCVDIVSAKLAMSQMNALVYGLQEGFHYVHEDVNVFANNMKAFFKKTVQNAETHTKLKAPVVVPPNHKVAGWLEYEFTNPRT